MSDHPGDSIAIRLPPETNNCNGEEQGSAAIKNPWSAIMCALREVWSPFSYDVGEIRNWNHDEQRQVVMLMRSFIQIVSHLVLCLTMTILLPISLPRRLISGKGRFTATWECLLAISFAALSFDALFLYIPFIDDNYKCIGMDTTLKVIALVLRSIIDLASAIHIEALIHDRIDVPPVDPAVDLSAPQDRVAHCIRCRRKWLSLDIIIGFICILPVPQVTIIIGFFRMRVYEYPYKTGIGNLFLISQFSARSYQLYRSQRQLTTVGISAINACVLYWFRYILACHVFGAFWYSYSIQREVSCWHEACRNIMGCVISYCLDTNSSANITLLNEFCPINPSNETIYNFGVFRDALHSGNTGPKSFWTKYLYTFSWGIRNLSTFGTNLGTSNHEWEICFTIFTSLFGLLLFIYLVGNVQTYILWESTKALEVQEEKVHAKYQALDTWLSRNGFDEGMKERVVNIIKQNKVVEKNYYDGFDVAVDLVFIFNAIKTDRIIKLSFFKHLCRNALKKVTIFQHLSLDDNELEALLKDFDPVSYKKDSYVVQKGKPDDKMLVITEGVITCDDINTSRFEKGEVYGQELLSMVNRPTPKSTQDVKCLTRVDSFVLRAEKFKGIIDFLERANMEALQYTSDDVEKANKIYRELTTIRSVKVDRKEKDIMEWLLRNGVPDDLQSSVMQLIRANHRRVLERHLDAEVDVKYLFSIGLPWNIEYDIKKHLCMSTLYKVPVLNSVDKDVLHRICMSLEPVILPENSCIVLPRWVLGRMLIIVGGEITLSGGTCYEPSGEIKKGKVDGTMKKGDFIGEELLTWALPQFSIPRYQPAVSNKYVECCTKVEAFALTKEGVESVVAYFRDGINKFEQLENGRDGVADTNGAFKCLFGLGGVFGFLFVAVVLSGIVPAFTKVNILQEVLKILCPTYVSLFSFTHGKLTEEVQYWHSLLLPVIRDSVCK